MRMVRIIMIMHILGIWLVAQTTHDIRITNIPFNEVQMAGFTLLSEKNLTIEAIGGGEKVGKEENRSFMADPNDMFAYAWILNARSREMVWRMTMNNTQADKGSSFVRMFKGDVQLPAGEYEVYYSARVPEYLFFDDDFFSFGKLFFKLFRSKERYEEFQENWYISIRNVDEVIDVESINKFHRALKNQAAVSLTGLGDSEFRQEGFNLTKEGTFSIYAIGESYKGQTFDYGWIVNATTSEKIWETFPDEGKYAGGARKNNFWRDTITLRPGNYWVYFVMDDSHSPSSWNANPPYDPQFYGITVSGVAGKFDPKSIEPLLKQKVQPIVELIRLGNDELVQEGFKLSVPMQIRVYAIGEGHRGEMFDYGWIVDLKTNEKIWEMTFNRTRHAGGAEKNRLVDEIITLAAGSYMVYFKTDGSHSFDDWNQAPPYNPNNWGIAIYPADPKYVEGNIQKLQEAALTENIIAQIVRVSDGRVYQERFEIGQDQDVRVYAIGEGDWDEMYDYGWIESAEKGNKVWEMKYEKTKWAGGAKKNRKIDQVIHLAAGKYILLYNTDSSHSFNDWNADPPDDPFHYGITVYSLTTP